MKRFIATGILAVFLLSTLAPLAMADKEDREERERGHRDSDAAKMEKRGYRHNISLDVDANGTRKNITYTVSIDGDGLSKKRDHDGNLTKARAFVTAHVVVKDGNGTILREGDLRLKVQLRLHEDGNWTWHMVAVGKKAKELPKLNLRGDAVLQSDGSFALDGGGKLVFKPIDGKRSVPVKLDATGTLRLG